MLDWEVRAAREHWTVSRARRAVAELLSAPAPKVESERHKNPGMRPAPDHRVTLFRDIADAFEVLLAQEEREYAEPEQIAMVLTPDSRSEIERAVARAAEFLGKWQHILDLQDAILIPVSGPDDDGIVHVHDDEWPPREQAV